MTRYLRRDRVWPRPKDLCYDRAFYVATELVKVGINYVATEFWPRPKGVLSR